MKDDFTQRQSLGELERAERLSMRTDAPPVELEGYRLEQLLGQGAFGQVWLGHDLNTGRKVAVKFYASRSSVNLSLINREVGHLVSMSTGSGIVQVLKVGWDAEPPYYIMEYLESGSLEDLIRDRGQLDVAESTRLFSDIADSLSYAHSKGVLHCDLKPANVMLDHDLKPRLADFGQSRLSDEQTPSLGTLFFMAPEQASLGASPDAAWDVYALGAIAYTMLVGEPPHRERTFLERLDAANSLQTRLEVYRSTIVDSEPPNDHYQVKGVDKALCQIVDRCLAASPEERFANVEQVISALQQRESARTRRPLLLLGIVAPVLLFLLMLFFSARSISVAKQESIQSVQQWSLRSNQFAAKLAAQSLESEFAALFRLVEEEARRPELVTRLSTLLQSQQALISELAQPSKENVGIDRLKASSEQQELENYLAKRMAVLLRSDPERRSVFNSFFVNGPRGTNLGIHFVDATGEQAVSPVGRNFAYRTYFNGLDHDASRDTDRSQFKPITKTHLSTVFASTSTGKLKVGISTPVVDSSENLDEPRIVGVFVLTINLGDFELLSGLRYEENVKQGERFAALVDGRPGTREGTLLQHPFLKWLETSVPVQDRPRAPQIDSRMLDELKAEGAIVHYKDPTATLEGGDQFEGAWIASIQEVKLPKSTVSSQFPADNFATSLLRRPSSNLWVLVQEKSSTVAAPVEELGGRLQLETLIEFVSLLAVMMLLWIVVFRFGNRESGSVRKAKV